MVDILKLIEDRCPDGVPYMRLDEVFDIVGGYSPSMDNEEFWTGGDVPFFRMENLNRCGCKLDSTKTDMFCTMDSVRGKPFPGMSLIVATCATIGVHALVCEDFLANRRFSVLKPAVFVPKIAGSRTKIAGLALDMDFANYYAFKLDEWCRANTNQGTFKTVNMTGFRAFPWPIPPLDVQREIVAILDRFTELEAELEAELEDREKQYAYYRERLFANARGVRVECLKDVTLFNGFKQVSADALKAMNTGVGDVKLLPSSANYDWCCELTADVEPFVCEGAVITVGKARHPHTKYHEGKFIASQSHVIRSADDSILYPKYLYHFINMRAQDFYTTESSYPLFTQAEFNRCKIPIPPLDVQREIVAILDRFHGYCYDMTSGLKGEIELRRQQYEYYRDLLLSFPEKAGC